MKALALFLMLLTGAGIAQAQDNGSSKDSELSERATVVFVRLLHSEEDAKALVNQLHTYKQHSPWEFETILQVAQKLVVAGYKPSDILPLFKPCGDAAVGLNVSADDDDFARIVGMMYDVRNEPDEVYTNLSILEKAGLPAYKILSEALGMKKEKVEKLARDNRLRNEVVYKVLLAGFEVHFGGLAEKVAVDSKK